MLNDEFRNRSYEKAIIKGIDQYPGNVSVCDVGCGTGLLSLIASNQPKCRSVYAIEKMKIMADIARKVFVENLKEESASKIRLINKVSSKMSVPNDLPNHAQILVTETFDAGLFGEGILPTLCHAWSNLLNQEEGEMHSLVVPSSAKLFVQAIESAAVLNESRLRVEADLYSLSHRNVCICSTVGMCAPDPYTTHDLKRLPGGYRALSEPCLFMEVDFNNPLELSELERGSVRHFSIAVTKAGRLDALAMWFSLCLLDAEEISTHTDRRGCWEQAIFPVNPLKLKQRGSSLNIASGDILKVSQLVKGAQHSLSVTDIDRSSCDDKPVLSGGRPGDGTESQPFLASTLQWCKSQIYCLASSEIAALNNTRLSAALCSQLHNLLPSETSCIQADFVHLNSGFSPLCLQALRMGYTRVWAIANSPVHQVLMWKLALENGIDTSQLSLMQDAAEICLDIAAKRKQTVEACTKPESMGSLHYNKTENDGDDCRSSVVGASECADGEERDSTKYQETQSEMAVVVLDVVDWQGRLLEDLKEKISELRNCMSTYSKVRVVPHCVDVYGVLIESEELLTRSRVVSDEQTLGYKIASYVNKFSTRNHQGIELQSLQHAKLCKPFRMFSLDLRKLLLVSKQPASEESCEAKTTVLQDSLNTFQANHCRHATSDKTSLASAIGDNRIVSEDLGHEEEIGVTNTMEKSESQTSTTKASTLHRNNRGKEKTDNAQQDKSSGSNECHSAGKCPKDQDEANEHAGDEFEQSANITVRITATGSVTALVYWFDFHLMDNSSTTTSNIMNNRSSTTSNIMNNTSTTTSNITTQISTNTTDALTPVLKNADSNFSSPSSSSQPSSAADFSNSLCRLNTVTAAHVTPTSASTAHLSPSVSTPIRPPTYSAPLSTPGPTSTTAESCAQGTSDSPSNFILASARSSRVSCSPAQASSVFSETDITSNSCQMPNFANVENATCPSSMTPPASVSIASKTTISTLDPAHHWQQAAVMTDPAKERKAVVKGNHLHLQCVMGSSAFSFRVED